MYQPGEEGVLRTDTRPNPARAPQVDPDLADQYNDVWTVGFERTVRTDVALAVTGIFKRERDLVGTADLAIPFSAFDPITVTNPVTNQPMTIYTQRLEYSAGRLSGSSPTRAIGRGIPRNCGACTTASRSCCGSV